MKILVDDIWAELNTYNPSHLAKVRELCRARPSGYRYMKTYRSGRWDGYISLMRGLKHFPSGLLELVCDGLNSSGIEFEVEYVNKDKIPFDFVGGKSLLGVELRDYQIRAIENLLSAGRGVARMATNSGKTEVMAGIIRSFGNKLKSVVVLHRKELLHQTVERFAARLGTDFEIGMVGDGFKKPGHVTVAMVQTLANHPELIDEHFQNNELLMVDECHHASSGQMMDILLSLPGRFRFGFSGTPLKYDVLSDMKLMAVTGPVVVEVTNEELIGHGWSATPEIMVYVVEGDEFWDCNYHEAYVECIMNNQTRNEIIRQITVSNKAKLILILVNRIEHGNLLHRLIPGSIFVHGSLSMEVRQGVIDSMRLPDASGVVIASPIFDEGVDIPGVDVVVLAGGGVSHIKLLQRIGRGMRRKGGDNRLFVVDFIDDTNNFLLRHSESRLRTYKGEGFQTRLTASNVTTL